jgi:flagellar basal body rod protein FlgG
MSDFLGVMAASMQMDISHLNTVAQNMANTSTTGFKRVFSLGSSSGDASAVMVDPRQGALKRTGSDLDLALEGPAFLSVLNRGEEWVSHGGALRLDARGRLLLSQSGLPLQGDAGDIFLQAGSFRVAENGDIYQGEQRVAHLKLIQPAKGARLEAAGNGLYRLRGEGHLPGRTDDLTQVRQGFLEMSNVNSTLEMVELMQLTRHFESVQKAVQGVDAIWDKAIRTLGEY